MSVLTIERHISGGLLVWLKYPAPVLREGSSDPRAPSDSAWCLAPSDTDAGATG